MQEPYYKKHVFFCLNQRDNGKKCCQEGGAMQLYEYASAKIKALGLSGKDRIRINKSGCFDRCAEGPMLVIYPEGIWCPYRSIEDIDKIIETYLL